ncbi:hypothetical protein WMF45_08985 [Sorangium sp. So ce448]|uniref:tetratricopeptide repeat protein n=1 Tax=Sorangium sp. So ce448 TaxID=3133314 RepID=UPI003F5DDD13
MSKNRETNRRSAAVSLLLLGLLCTSPAAAQDGPMLAQSKTAAVALAEQGWGHYEASRYAEALQAFRQAEAKAHASPFLLMVARCYVKLGRFLEARDVYRLVVDEKLAHGAPPAFAEAKASATKELADLEARTPTVEINVTGTVPAGLEMTLDGLPIQRSTPVQRDPGAHTLVVRWHGGRPLTRDVQLAEGARERVEIDQVTLDALLAAKRPADTAGSRTHRPGKPGVQPLAQGDHDAAEWSDTKGRTAVLIGGGAAATLGLAAGVVLTAMANGRASRAEAIRNELKARWNGEKKCPEGDVSRCRELSDAVDAEIAFGNLAFWSLLTGGTVGVGTLVYGLVTRKSTAPAPGPRVAPLLGPGIAGVSFSGRF